MFSTKQIEVFIGWILLIGTILSGGLVLLGGCLYLIAHGHESITLILTQSPSAQETVSALFSSPLGFIELGLFLLIFTQIVRVALLTLFYALTRDKKFTAMSLFILLVLIYSIFWRN